MFRALLIILCMSTFAACTWPFADAKNQSVGTDFEYQDMTTNSKEAAQGDASISWDK